MVRFTILGEYGDVLSVAHRDRCLTVVQPTRAGEPWTDEECAKLRRRFEQGVSLVDLVIVHQRTHGAIVAELKRLGAVRPRATTLGASGARTSRTSRARARARRRRRR